MAVMGIVRLITPLVIPLPKIIGVPVFKTIVMPAMVPIQRSI